MATLPDWLLAIDPDPAAWEDKGLNRYWHTATKKQYDSGDMVNYMIRQYNAKQKAEGKAPYIPGIKPVPDEIKTIPKGMTREEYEEHAPPGDWDIVKARQQPAPGGGGAGGDPYLDPLNPGFTWNPSGGSGGTALEGGAAFGPAMKWDAGPGGRGQADPERTGYAMPFKPYGTIQDYSSEILRYGGAPRSGTDGHWTDIATPTMRSIGGAAPPAAPVEVPGFTPNTYQAPVSGGGYQNVTTSAKDGTLWTDPSNGQKYVWRNGQYQKIDTRSRPGPVRETPVTNHGGTGTVNDPIRIDIGGDTTDPAVLAALLRQGVA